MMAAATSQMRRPSLLGVLYAEDFDERGENGSAASEAALEPEIIEPVFSAAELEAARADARQSGRTEAEQELANSTNQLLELVAAGIANSRAAALDAAQAAAEGVARCMLSALAVCLPKLCERHGPAELLTFVQSLLPALSEEPRITIRVHSTMAPVIQLEVARLDPDFAERVQVVSADGMPPGDARITWAEGSATRDTVGARAAFEDGLAQLGLLQQERIDA